MSLIFEHPSDPRYALSVNPAADVFVGGASVAACNFHSGSSRSDAIAVPANSAGIIQIRAAITMARTSLVGLTTTSNHSFIANWAYAKQNGRIRLGSFSMSSGDHFHVPAPQVGDLRCIAPKQEDEGNGTILRLGLCWTMVETGGVSYSPPFGISFSFSQSHNDPRTFWLSLQTAQPTPSVTHGSVALDRISIERRISFGPFVTGSTELENGSLILSVRDWINSLSFETQSRLERAQSPDQMPGGTQILIEGFASSAGGAGENLQLAGDRAVAVMNQIRTLTGNHALDAICRAPSRGEERETDDPALENNDPASRRVDVTYYEL